MSVLSGLVVKMGWLAGSESLYKLFLGSRINNRVNGVKYPSETGTETIKCPEIGEIITYLHVVMYNLIRIWTHDLTLLSQNSYI